MDNQLLICTDLDRTLIPNGHEPESRNARQYFAKLVALPDIKLAYVSGRDLALVKEAIKTFSLPLPDYIIGDVGTTIYKQDQSQWKKITQWDKKLSPDWAGHTNQSLQTLLTNIPALRLQESQKQNQFKLSYYLPTDINEQEIINKIKDIFQEEDIKSSLIYSVDEIEGVGLLDILPASASKLHAIEALIQIEGFSEPNTVFSGDSGNDIEVLSSHIKSTLVANAPEEVRALAIKLAAKNGNQNQLYIAQGMSESLNGNYSAGIIEGVMHYFPHYKSALSFD